MPAITLNTSRSGSQEAPNATDSRFPVDLLNMHGDFLTYGGQRVDIGPASIRLLRGIVTEFRAAVLFDSIETLAAADPNRVGGLLRRAASTVRLVRLMKQVRGLVTSPRANAADTAG